MAKSQAEMLRESLGTTTRLDTDMIWVKADPAQQRGDRIRAERDIVVLRLEVAQLRGEHLAMARELADWRRRSEIWSQRWWGLGVGLFLATVAAAAALIRRLP